MGWRSGLDPDPFGVHMCVYFNPSVCLFLSSLHAGLLCVLGPIPTLCLSSLSSAHSCMGSSLAPQRVGLWAARGGCGLCMGVGSA